MYKLRTVLSLLLAVIMVVSLFGCSSTQTPSDDTSAAPGTDTPATDDASEDEGFYIGYNNMFLTEDFFITVSKGLSEAAAASDITFEETVAERDATRMKQNIETFVTKGADLVIDFNVLAEAGSAIASDLKAKNIPMISIDCIYDDAYFFGVNNYGAGEVLGEATIELVKEKFGGEIDYVVSLWDSQSGDEIKSRCTGVVDKLVDEFGLLDDQIVWLDSFADDVKTGTMTRDWLNSHPDARKVVFVGQNDDRGYAINNVVVGEGRVEDCIIVSHNADPSSIENLQKHVADKNTAWMATASYNSHLYGEQVIDMAKRILNGEEVAEAEYTKVTIVTLKNVEEYVAGIQ